MCILTSVYFLFFLFIGAENKVETGVKFQVCVYAYVTSKANSDSD